MLRAVSSIALLTNIKSQIIHKYILLETPTSFCSKLKITSIMALQRAIILEPKTNEIPEEMSDLPKDPLDLYKFCQKNCQQDDHVSMFDLIVYFTALNLQMLFSKIIK